MVKKSSIAAGPALAWQDPVLQSCGHTVEGETFHESVLRSTVDDTPRCQTCEEPLAPWAPTNHILVAPGNSRSAVRQRDTSHYPDAGVTQRYEHYNPTSYFHTPSELRGAEAHFTHLLSTPPLESSYRRHVLEDRGHVRYRLGNRQGFYSDLQSAKRLDPQYTTVLESEQKDFASFARTYENKLLFGATARPVSDEEIEYATLDPLTCDAVTDPVTFLCGHTFDERSVNRFPDSERVVLRCPIDRLTTPWFLRNFTAAQMSATLGTRGAGEPKDVLHVFAPMPLNLLINQDEQIKKAFEDKDYGAVLRLNPRHTEARSLRAAQLSAAFRQRKDKVDRDPTDQQSEGAQLQQAARYVFNEWYDCLLARPNDAAFKRAALEFVTDPRDRARLWSLYTSNQSEVFTAVKYCWSWLRDMVKNKDFAIQSDKEAEMLLWALRFKALRLDAIQPRSNRASREIYKSISRYVISEELWRTLPWTQAQRADFVHLQGSLCGNVAQAARLFHMTPVDAPAARAYAEYAEVLSIRRELDAAPTDALEAQKLQRNVVEGLRLTLEQALQSPRSQYAKHDTLPTVCAEQLAEALWEVHSDHAFVVEQLAELYAQVGEAMPIPLKVLFLRSFYKLDDDTQLRMQSAGRTVVSNRDAWLEEAFVAPSLWVRSMLHEIDAKRSNSVAMEMTHRTVASVLRQFGGGRPLA